MKVQLKNFSIIKTSLIISAVYLVLSAIFAIPIGIFYLLMGQSDGLFILFVPLLYWIIGFAFTALALYIYNFVAKQLSGIEVEVKEIK